VRFQVDSVTGMIDPAVRCLSQNQDRRPVGVHPELVVIHSISLPPGEFGGPYIEELFTNQLDPLAHPFFREIEGLKVSSHLLIRRDGKFLQFVPFTRRAWHAGESFFRGRTCCNDFSIGIELEGTDDTSYTDQQYDVLVRVLSAIMAAYPGVTPYGVVGHCDIAPGRKTDPGPYFDWLRLYDGLKMQAGAYQRS